MYIAGIILETGRRAYLMSNKGKDTAYFTYDRAAAKRYSTVYKAEQSIINLAIFGTKALELVNGPRGGYMRIESDGQWFTELAED